MFEITSAVIARSPCDEAIQAVSGGAGTVLKRQPDIILRQRRHRGLRLRDVVELGELDARTDGAGVGEFVQHRGHPPGEAHRLPDPRQRLCRIGIDTGVRFLVIEFAEGEECMRC